VSHASLVVCFGDSLTAGYQSPLPEWPQLRQTPYGAFLQERLGGRVRILVSGICGEVTSEMVQRFRQNVLELGPAYTVILGGTNDLGWNADPSVIMQNLRSMYEQARASGVEPVAVTVPSIRADIEPAGGDRENDRGVAGLWLDDHIARRKTLNRQISAYCRDTGISCVDLFTATAEAETGRLAAEYSNDGLHLTTAGYRRLADLLYDEVFASAFADGSQ
jgi:lysophospholipase L1-like esterase